MPETDLLKALDRSIAKANWSDLASCSQEDVYELGFKDAWQSRPPEQSTRAGDGLLENILPPAPDRLDLIKQYRVKWGCSLLQAKQSIDNFLAESTPPVNSDVGELAGLPEVFYAEPAMAWHPLSVECENQYGGFKHFTTSEINEALFKHNNNKNGE